MIRLLRAMGLATCVAAAAGAVAQASERTPLRASQSPAAAEAPRLPVATDARIAGDRATTRFVLDLDRRIDLFVFTLADPYRVVIDVPQVDFRLPARAGQEGRGLVRAFRFGVVMQGGSRIVIDVTDPVIVERALVSDPAEGQPARLVVELARTDRETFMRNLAIDGREPRTSFARNTDRELPAPRPRGEARDPRAQLPLVVVDPGHGGLDTGAVAATGETEKQIVLEIAHMLRDKLERTGRYRVALTRSDDSFVPLAERVRFARSRQAALFISLHADALAVGDGEARGATVYTLSDTASDAEAARVAERENRSDVLAGVDLAEETDAVADILMDLTHRETKTFSAQFARTLVGEMRQAARLHRNPLRGAGFRVLRAHDVPSVLLELGYISTPADLRLLTSPAWRDRATDAITQAVNGFFSNRVAAGALPAPVPLPVTAGPN